MKRNERSLHKQLIHHKKASQSCARIRFFVLAVFRVQIPTGSLCHVRADLLAPRKAGSAERLGGFGARGAGNAEDACNHFLDPRLRLVGERVPLEQLSTELLMRSLIGLNAIPINADSLVITQMITKGDEVFVDRVGNRLQGEEPGCDSIRGESEGAKEFEEWVRSGHLEPGQVKAEKFETIRNELKMARLVSRLSGKGNLDVNFAGRGHPMRRELAHAHFVDERDLK